MLKENGANLYLDAPYLIKGGFMIVYIYLDLHL